MDANVAAWIEPDPAEPDAFPAVGIQYVAGQRAIDRIAGEQEALFKTALLLQRKEEFTARSIFDWVMQEESK